MASRCDGSDTSFHDLSSEDLDGVESAEFPDCDGRQPLGRPGVAPVQEDAASVASEESQWLLVEDKQEQEEDEDLLVMVASDGEEVLMKNPSAEEPSEQSHPIAAAVAAAMAAVEETSNDAVEPECACEVPDKASAAFVAVGAPEFCSDALSVCPQHPQGDVTQQWGQALQDFPDVKGAYRLGRLIISQEAADCGAQSAFSRIVVCNDGSSPWPEASALRLVAGAGWSFHELGVGALAPGHAAELLLDVAVPATLAEFPGAGERSAWVLEDGTGRPFGPLLVLEVICA